MIVGSMSREFYLKEQTETVVVESDPIDAGGLPMAIEFWNAASIEECYEFCLPMRKGAGDESGQRGGQSAASSSAQRKR